MKKLLSILFMFILAGSLFAISEGQGKREVYNEVESMHNDSRDGDSRRTIRNKSDGTSARAVKSCSKNIFSS